MKKSIFTLLCVLVLLAVMFFVACGNPDAGGGDVPAQTSGGADEQTATPGDASGTGSTAEQTTTPGGASSASNSSEEPSEDAEVIRGTIATVYDSTSFLLAADDLYVSTVGYQVEDATGKALSAGALKPGQKVEAVFNGLVLESYPAQFDPSTVKILEEGDDMIGFFLEVLDTLWKEDPGLNPQVTPDPGTGESGIFAIDISNVENLESGERSALIYLAGSRYGVDWVASNHEKLAEEGYIDEKNLSFKNDNGILITISTSDVKAERFKFRAEKWASGLGADYYEDCKATKKNGKWTFELGGFAIS